MPQDKYEKTIQILKELEAGDSKFGLFSCFGRLPSGEVVYFDEVGSPRRAILRGRVFVSGPLLNLPSQPVEVISELEAFQLLARREQDLYQHKVREKFAARQRWEKSRPRRTLRWVGAGGLVLGLLFAALLVIYPGGPEQKLRSAEQNLKDFYAQNGISINGYKDVTVINTGGYNPLGPVSISRGNFKQFLKELNSPALPEADSMYDACLAEGCDPALLLAFFEHESSGGNQGVAAITRSIGNIRCSEGYTCYTTPGNGSFRQYTSWTEGARDWARLLKFYKDDWKRLTLEDIIPKYAPQSDNNNEAAYISSVKLRVDDLRKREQPAAGKVSNGDLPLGNPVWESDWVISQGFSPKHPEIDITRPLAVAEGTPIHTTLSGVVTVVRNDPLFGNRVIITGKDFSTHFNHLTGNVPAQNGQQVNRGDIIGYMGNTGKSTGPHLDYEIFQGSQHLNPVDWLLRGN